MGIFDIFGGGDQQQSATGSTTQQAYLPSWFGVPQQQMLEQSYQQAMKPYQPYQGAQVAGFSPAQIGVQNNILGQSMPNTWGQAGGAYTSGLGMIGDTVNRYNSFNPIQTFGEAQKYKPVASNTLENLLKYYDFKKFDPKTFSSNYDAQQFATQSFTEDGIASKYMNPYIQEALNPTLRKMQELSDTEAQRNAYSAQQARGFGGSRHGVLDSLQQYNTKQEQSDVQAEGMATAYQAASQLYGDERTRFLNAFQANEQARYNDASLDLTADQYTEQSRQFGAGFGLDQARLRLGADQFDTGNRIQQNQFGATHRLGALQFDSSLGAQVAGNKASIGLQGANSYFTGGAGLGALSNSYMSARSAMLAQQQQAAQQQQDLAQRMLDQRYTNYTEGRDWSQNQLSWLAQMLQSARVPMESENYQYKTDAYQSPFDIAGGVYNARKNPDTDGPTSRPTPAPSPWGGSIAPGYNQSDPNWYGPPQFAKGGVVPSGIPAIVANQYLAG